MKLYTTAEAATVLGVKRDTIKQYIRRNLIPATKRGRDWFISSSELEKFKRNRRKVGRP